MSNGDRVTPQRTDDASIPPPESFIEQANVTSESIYEEFDENWPECWERAASFLDWTTNYDTVLDADGPRFRWFAGGKLNASYNCVDRHLDERKNQTALHWEAVDGETRTYTYLELYHAVNECAAALRSLGVEEGDVVTLYLPMVPELPIAMLACARIGAPHSVVFVDFPADVLTSRIERTESAYLITADGYYRSADAINLKNTADNARIAVDREMTVVIVDRLGGNPHLGPRHYWYDSLIADHAEAEIEPVVRDASAPLFRIYTSGTTGEPKVVEHTTGGYLAHVAWTGHTVLDITPEDTYWCAADVSWITGHSYIVYGPLALGTTSVMYEGLPERSGKHRVWDVIERNDVNILYTSPTTIRSFMKQGAKHPAQYDLSPLRLLGSVGESIDPRTWQWYYTHVGNENCPIVDTWWQTETGAILLSTLPGIDPMMPGAVGQSLPGIDAQVVDATGTATGPNETGYLTIAKPWPGMPCSLATHQNGATDHDEHFGDDWVYVSGDGAIVNANENITVLGRVDDEITVAGHRLATTEIEHVIAEVEGVAETAVVSEIEENVIHAYVIPEQQRHRDAELHDRVATAIETVTGTVEISHEIILTPDLPKTRSGKTMRRLLKAVVNDEEIGDITALRNPELVGELQSGTCTE